MAGSPIADVPLVEVCVDSVEGALAAETAGAHRVELCAALSLGGLTPGPGLLQETLSRCRLPVVVMVRPRAGDFLYSVDEHRVMQGDVRAAVAAGAHGVALGLLHADGSVDRERTAELVELAHPLPVTFHRAFDMCRDPEQELETLIASGVRRLLTSGQAPTAPEGIPRIRALVRAAGDRLTVIAGGGVRAANAVRLVTEGRVRELHLSARAERDGGMRFRNPRVSLGSQGSSGAEYGRTFTDPDQIAALLAELRGEPGR